MTWYAIYNNATGKLFATQSTEPAGLPDGMAFKAFDFNVQKGYVWDAATLTFDALPAAKPILSPYEFLLLFTAAERIEFNAARASDPYINDFWSLLERAQEIDLGDAMTIAGVNYYAASEYTPLFTSERAAAVLNGEAP